MMNSNQYQQGVLNRPVFPQTSVNLRIRPVSSLEEVRAAGVDFDGSVFFFPDFANKKIYTKAIGLDGTAILNMYELKEMPKSDPNSFVTREEFNATLEEIKTALNHINASAVMSDPSIVKEQMDNQQNQQKNSIMDF